MTLRKGGLVYNIAYAWRHAYRMPPKQTTLCALFWRCVLSLLFMWPLVIIGYVIGFPFAMRPRVYANDPWNGDGPPLISYRNWPTIDEDMKIRPLAVAIIIGLCYLLYLYVPDAFVWCISIMVWLWKSHLLFFGIAATVLLIGLVSAFTRFQKTETYTLLKAYAKAKKQKVCPIIAIEA